MIPLVDRLERSQKLEISLSSTKEEAHTEGIDIFPTPFARRYQQRRASSGCQRRTWKPELRQRVAMCHEKIAG